MYCIPLSKLLGNSTLEQITGLVDQQLTVEKAND